MVSNYLGPHWLQLARLPCPSQSPGVCSSSCPLNRLCYLAISSSATLFFFCLQSFLASESFPMIWLFPSGGKVFELQYHLPITTHGPVPNPLEVLCSPASNINLSKYLLKEIPSQEPRITGDYRIWIKHRNKTLRVVGETDSHKCLHPSPTLL